MANALFSECGLPKKYWSEMVFTANELRNRMLVTGRDITQYESKTGLQLQLSDLSRVDQRRYAQDWKPQTGWKKFTDGATTGILVGYRIRRRSYLWNADIKWKSNAVFQN